MNCYGIIRKQLSDFYFGRNRIKRESMVYCVLSYKIMKVCKWLKTLYEEKKNLTNCYYYEFRLHFERIVKKHHRLNFVPTLFLRLVIILNYLFAWQAAEVGSGRGGGCSLSVRLDWHLTLRMRRVERVAWNTDLFFVIL